VIEYNIILSYINTTGETSFDNMKFRSKLHLVYNTTSQSVVTVNNYGYKQIIGTLNS